MKNLAHLSDEEKQSYLKAAWGEIFSTKGIPASELDSMMNGVPSEVVDHIWRVCRLRTALMLEKAMIEVGLPPISGCFDKPA